jgi:hypothetical protein
MRQERLAYDLLSLVQQPRLDFVCFGVVYSGEYDTCDVTLSVYPHRASLKKNSSCVQSSAYLQVFIDR